MKSSVALNFLRFSVLECKSLENILRNLEQDTPNSLLFQLYLCVYVCVCVIFFSFKKRSIGFFQKDIKKQYCLKAKVPECLVVA